MAVRTVIRTAIVPALAAALFASLARAQAVRGETAEEAVAVRRAVEAEGPASAAARIAEAARAEIPGEAVVAFVRDGEVYVDAGTDDGYGEGLRLVAYRPGAEIRSPRTGEVVGRATEEVARLVVEWADASMARAEGKGGDLRVGDLVRPETTIVGVLPLRHADGRRTALTRRLDDVLARTLAEAGLRTQEGPATSARPGDAAFAVGSVPGAVLVVGGRVEGGRVHWLLFRAHPPALLEEADAPVPADLASLAETVVEYVRGAEGPGGEIAGGDIVRHRLPRASLDVAAADVDGDGRDEVLVLERRKVRVLRMTPQGGFEEVEAIGLGWNADALRISSGDLDGDGVDEFVLVEKPGDFVRSSLYRRDGGRYRRVERWKNRFVRFVAFPGRDRLFAQGYGHDRVFDPNVSEVVPRGGGFVEEGSGLPSGVTNFAWAPVPTLSLTAAIDYENRIRLYNATGEVTWRSSEGYGGSNLLIAAASGRDERRWVEGLRFLPPAGEGLGTLLAVQNFFSGGSTGGFVRLARAGNYEDGRLVGLAFEGGGLVERFATQKFGGPIEGFDVGRFRGRGLEALLLVRPTKSYGGFFGDADAPTLLVVSVGGS